MEEVLVGVVRVCDGTRRRIEMQRNMGYGIWNMVRRSVVMRCEYDYGRLVNTLAKNAIIAWCA